MSGAPSLSSRIGQRHAESMRVEPRHTVPQVDAVWPGFQGMPPVFATAMMVGFIEQTCVQALQGFLEPGEGTVGIHVDVSHIAATPVGGQVTAEVELVEVAGRKLRFKVACRDEDGAIGEGTHERAIINVERFLAKTSEKAKPRGGA